MHGMKYGMLSGFFAWPDNFIDVMAINQTMATLLGYKDYSLVGKIAIKASMLPFPLNTSPQWAGLNTKTLLDVWNRGSNRLFS